MLDESLLRQIQDEYESTLLTTRLKKDDFLKLQRTMVAQKSAAPSSPPRAAKINGVSAVVSNGKGHDDNNAGDNNVGKAKQTIPTPAVVMHAQEDSDDEDEGLVLDLGDDDGEGDVGILLMDITGDDEDEEDDDDDLMLYPRPCQATRRRQRGGAGQGKRRRGNPWVMDGAEVEDGGDDDEDEEDDDDEEESQYDTDDDEEEESDYDSEEEDDEDFDPRDGEDEGEGDDDNDKGEEEGLDDDEIEDEDQEVVYTAKGKRGSKLAKLFGEDTSKVGLVVNNDEADDVFVAPDDGEEGEGGARDDECEEADDEEWTGYSASKIPSEGALDALCQGSLGHKDRKRLTSVFGCYFRLIMTNAMCKRSIDRMRERAMNVPPGERGGSHDWGWHVFLLAVEKKAKQLTDAVEEAHRDAGSMTALLMRLKKSISVAVTEHRPKRRDDGVGLVRLRRTIVEEGEGDESALSATVTCSLTGDTLNVDDAARVVLVYDEKKMGLADDARMGGDKSPNSVFVCSAEHAVLCSSFFFLCNIKDMCTATFARWFDSNSSHIARKDSVEEVCMHMHKTQFSNQHPIPKIGSRFADAVSYVQAYLSRHKQEG